jgi:hypothetical protein
MAPDISGLSEIPLNDSNPAIIQQAYDRVRGESGTNYEFILYILYFTFPPPKDFSLLSKFPQSVHTTPSTSKLCRVRELCQGYSRGLVGQRRTR